MMGETSNVLGGARRQSSSTPEWLGDEERGAKDTLLEKLSAMGAAALEVEYDGQCGEGVVQTLSCVGPVGAEVAMPFDVERAAEEFVALTLPDGWEVESGSYGTVTFDVTSGRVRYSHTTRLVVERDDEWEA